MWAESKGYYIIEKMKEDQNGEDQKLEESWFKAHRNEIEEMENVLTNIMTKNMMMKQQTELFQNINLAMCESNVNQHFETPLEPTQVENKTNRNYNDFLLGVLFGLMISKKESEK